MNNLTQIQPEWQGWIVENLARGCDPRALIEVMIEKNFDPVVSKEVVMHFANYPCELAVSAETIQYVSDPPRMTQDGNFIQTSDRKVEVVARFTHPRVVVLDDVLSAKECVELVRLSKSKLKRSTIVDPKTGHEEVIAERTSSGTYFSLNENELIAKLDLRISELMNWPIENGEGIQILHYKQGDEYKPHFDYFPVSDPGSQMHLKNGGQRVSTLIIYLNDVESGGETVFPEIGLSVTPKKGSAVYFEYCNSRGQVDPLTLHGGLPVVKGEKWIATKWMREHSI